MSKVPYIDRGGDIVFSQPFAANGVNFYGFILSADEQKLQAYCDQSFNQPSGGQVNLRPVGPFVMLVFCDLQELKATDEPFSHYGAFREGECAVWLLTVDAVRQRLFWAFPYIWVDNEYAMAMGRELYGFPKGMAQFQMPETHEQADAFTMQTLIVREFGIGQRGELAELIGINRVSGPEKTSWWSALKSGLTGAWDFLTEHQTLLQDLRLGANELNDIVHGRVPFVFLKQFRDVEDGSKACYQSIVETPCGLTKFYSGGLLHGDYGVRIQDCASHPIRERLGLDQGTIRPVLSFWSRFDFEIGNGVEVWKA